MILRKFDLLEPKKRIEDNNDDDDKNNDRCFM